MVQSQVIKSGVDARQRGIRLVLHGLQSHRTLSARLNNDFFGPGVQHIALATSNIRAATKRVAANGVRALPIPENQCDVLDVRADLAPAEIDELKASSILYDRDACDAFCHARAKTLDGGFFFEIVQRDGYAGYGAPNAGIRLAAQARLARPLAVPLL